MKLTTRRLALVLALTIACALPAAAQLPGPPVGAPQSAQSTDHGYNFVYTWTPAAASGATFRIATTLQPSVLTGMTIDTARIVPTFVFGSASQTTTTLTGLRILAPTVTNTVSSTITNTALLKLEAAATAGTNNYSFWSVGAARFDAAIAGAGAIQSTSGTAGVGYGTGAGCSVAQGTDKSTTVVCTGMTGQITMMNSTLNAGVEVGFTVTDTSVGANDVPIVVIKSGATASSYLLTVDAVAAGSFHVTVSNASAGNLGEALVLQFAILKGAVS